MELGRIKIQPDLSFSSTSTSGHNPLPRLKIHIVLSEAEKKVAKQRAQVMRETKTSRGKAATMQQPDPLQPTLLGLDSRLDVLVVHPNLDVVPARLVSILDVCIDSPGVFTWSGEIGAPMRNNPVSLAQWWMKTSQGKIQWTQQQTKTVKQILITYNKGKELIPIPADKVRRREAFIPWDEDSKLQAQFNQASSISLTSNSASLDDLLRGSFLSSLPSFSSPPPLPLSSPISFHARDCFIAAAGFELLSVDYSNIELRLIAHFSNDKPLVNMFRQNRKKQ